MGRICAALRAGMSPARVPAMTMSRVACTQMSMPTILYGELSQCVEVERLRRFGERGGVQVEEEVHRRTDADLSRLDTGEVVVEQGVVLRCVTACERIGRCIGIHGRIAVPILVRQSRTEGVQTAVIVHGICTRVGIGSVVWLRTI